MQSGSDLAMSRRSTRDFHEYRRNNSKSTYSQAALAAVFQVRLKFWDRILDLDNQLRQDFRSMCSTEYNPAMLGVTAEQLRPFIVQLTQIDAQILSGNCLRNCYEQSYGDLDDDLNFANHLKVDIVFLRNIVQKSLRNFPFLQYSVWVEN